MRKATKEDISKVKDILCKSFAENKSANYVLRSKNKLPELFDYSISKGILFGDIWISDDNNACAILIDPKRKKFSLQSIWLDIQLAINVVGISRVKKVMKKEAVTNDTLPKNLDYIHLWFLGVNPSEQGKGIGGKFLTELIEKYKPYKTAMCLETSTLRNLPFYEKNGFEVYNIKNFGFDLYFFKRYFK